MDVLADLAIGFDILSDVQCRNLAQCKWGRSVLVFLTKFGKIDEIDKMTKLPKIDKIGQKLTKLTKMIKFEPILINPRRIADSRAPLSGHRGEGRMLSVHR